jgi:peptide/nickel transport system permease protein
MVAVRRLSVNDLTTTGVVTIVVLGLLTLLAPALWPHSPYGQNAELIFKSPSVGHWFGTDESGRDLFARASRATGISLAIGILSVVIGALIGIPFGTVSAYSGGRADVLMQRAVDIFMSFPLLIMGLMIIAAVGSGFWPLVLAIGIAQSPRFARMARGCTLVVKELAFIEASRSFGASHTHIMVRHILQNIAGPLVVQSVLFLSDAIMVEAGLSFLGLGIQPPTPTLGNLIRGGVSFLAVTPWLSIIPGALLSVLILGFHLAGDGLRDQLAPEFR